MGYRPVSETIGVTRGLVDTDWWVLGLKPTPRAQQVSPSPPQNPLRSREGYVKEYESPRENWGNVAKRQGGGELMLDKRVLLYLNYVNVMPIPEPQSKC